MIFFNSFYLTNFIKSKTCYTKNHKSLIDLLFANEPLSFQKTHVTETGVSDYHKLISTFFQSQFSKARPKDINYRKYKNFDKNNFINDLNNINVRLDKENPNQCYNSLTTSILEVRNRHAPLKNKTIRENCLDKNYHIFQTTRFNHAMIFFKLINSYKLKIQV